MTEKSKGMGTRKNSFGRRNFCLDTEIVINSLSLIRQKRLDLTLDDLAIIFNYFYLKSFLKITIKK